MAQKTRKTSAVNRSIVLLARKGYSGADIAARVGLSRSRVWVVLKDHGLDGSSVGARSQVGRARRDAILSEEHARKLRRSFGVEPEVVSGICEVDGGKEILAVFLRAKSNARRRGVAWNLDLGAWWACWNASGYWGERGMRQGQYVLRRVDVALGYLPGNIMVSRV